jgi:hypothetical protein
VNRNGWTTAVSNPTRTRAANGRLIGNTSRHIKWLCPLRGKMRRSATPHFTSKGTLSTLNLFALYPLGTQPEGSRLLPRATHLGKGAANRKKSSSASACHSERKKGKEEYCLEVRRFDLQRGSDESPQDFRASSPIPIRGSKVGLSEGLQNRPRAHNQG